MPAYSSWCVALQEKPSWQDIKCRKPILSTIISILREAPLLINGLFSISGEQVCRVAYTPEPFAAPPRHLAITASQYVGARPSPNVAMPMIRFASTTTGFRPTLSASALLT